MSEYFSQTQKNIIIQVPSDTLMGRKKKNPTDPFEIGWVDLYSDKKKKRPTVIKCDDKLREENYKFVQERYENNITPHTKMKASKLQNSDDKRRPRWAR